MNNPRKYGNAPYTTAVIHGGPGGPGGMAPVARGLAKHTGVLEPLQTSDSLEGQVEELKNQLEENGRPPIVLVGSSWGAMLSFIFAARFPWMVSKLILIGSGVFEEKYAAGIMETRLKRLDPTELIETNHLMETLRNPETQDKTSIFSQLGKTFTRTDTFDPLTLDTEVLECQYHMHTRVWRDAQQLRASGKLLQMGKSIQCPVLALHGDFDPHPEDGVRIPLESVLTDFHFILLENCGHYPWLERQAHERFWKILIKEILGVQKEQTK